MPGPFKLATRLRRLARTLLRHPEQVNLPPPPWRPIVAADPTDVFIVAYPKSGITWVQRLVAGTIYGLDPAQAPDSLIQDLVPDVHYKQFYKRYRTPTFFKTHDLPRPEHRRVVYLLRDGRDVMVSYWRHLQALHGRAIDFAKLVQGEQLFPCRWHDHVEQWLANPHGARLLTIRYEDLQKNPVQELSRLCAFVEEPRPASKLAELAEKCSFASMQRQEQRFGWDNPAWPKDKPFVRRGIVGSYQDEMPPDILTLFRADADPTLEKLGYLST